MKGVDVTEQREFLSAGYCKMLSETMNEVAAELKDELLGVTWTRRC